LNKYEYSFNTNAYHFQGFQQDISIPMISLYKLWQKAKQESRT